MPALPPSFGERVNDVNRALTQLEGTGRGGRKAALANLMAVACRLLRDIDLASLRADLDLVLSKAESVRAQDILDDSEHFEFFIKNVEDAMLSAADVDRASRARIAQHARDIRSLARSYVNGLSADQLITAIRELRDEICRIARDTRVELDEDDAKQLAIKTIMVGLIVVNAAGSVIYPAASVAALSASVTIGGVAQYLGRAQATAG